MQISTDGFENPNLIAPGLKKIEKRAREIGFSATQLKSFQKKLKLAFDRGIADPDQALLSLERLFLENEDLKWVLQKERLSAALRLFGYCEQVSQWALKSPANFLAALKKVEQGKTSKGQIFQELSDKTEDAESFKTLSSQLREFRHQEYLRLALANLGSEDRFEDEIAELTDLAEASLELGLKELLRLMQAGKIPQLKKICPPLSLCVLGMGKLGSEELNFSSDIDLIYLTPPLAEEGKAGSDLLNIYAQFAQLFTELISKITEQGLVFRVDLRLRPGGENGPLVNPDDSALDYYLNFGRSWERAAMLRARPVGGDLELGKKFLSELGPFLFRRFHDFASLEDLKEIKNRIDREAKKESGQKGFAGYNLKLGPGGIREVEFFVNALQLIYGGKNPGLRVTRTMSALSALNQLGLVKDQDAEILKRSWKFLRKLEHRIQLKDLRQEHKIPKTRRGQEILARSLGYFGKDGPGKFLSELGKSLNEVQEIFSGLFGEEAKEEKKLTRLVDWESGTDELEQEFQKLGFAEPDLAMENWARILKPLSQGKPGPRLRTDLLPVLLEEISSSPEPDLALRQFERFLSRTGARVGFLSLLKDHPGVRKLLLNLFSTSEFLGNLLINHPELLDELVSPQALKERGISELEAELAREANSGRDYEEKLARMRRFQKLELLRIGLKDLAGELEVRELEQRLSTLAELILKQAYQVSWEAMIAKYGAPVKRTGEKNGLVVLGLGKLGSGEMSWASDLDLIFIFQGEGETSGKNPLEVREFFIKLSQKIIATLQAQTPEGFLYKIDTRLRPSGTYGPLVVDAAAFEEYHRSQSRVWEKQALIKARVMKDGAGIKDEISGQIANSVFRGNRPEHLKEEMQKLIRRVRTELAQERENLYDIKFGYGGEMELDYILQYLQMANGESRPEIRAGNSWAALEQLKKFKLLENSEFRRLQETLLLFRRVSARLRIFQDRPENLIRLEESELERLARKIHLPGIDSGRELRKGLEAAREKVHGIFVKYIGD